MTATVNRECPVDGCTIEKGHHGPHRSLGDGTIRDLVMNIRRDLSYAQTKLTDLVQALDTLGAMHLPRTAVNGPVTAPGCPDCGCGDNVHTGDCPQAARNQEGTA